METHATLTATSASDSAGVGASNSRRMNPPLSPAPLLRLRQVEKSYAGVQALRPINLELGAGETLGLIGENGAGKSTLIKLLSGVIQPDGGVLEWDGRPARFASPTEALDAGIATIHQELAYFSNLTVAENMMLGERWPRRAWGGVDWRALNSGAERRLADFDLPIKPDARFSSLSAAEKQEVAIARALARRARLLILDEPTASLSEAETRRLLSYLARLRASGVAIVYVSHRLAEVREISDRIAVLRDGELVACYPVAEAETGRMVRDMVGRPLDQVYPRTRALSRGAPALEVENLTRREMFEDISFTIHAGEIVGLAGLVGAGRSELARAIYGLYPIERGSMRRRGESWPSGAAHRAAHAGLVYLPEERKRQGLVLDHSLGSSISIGFLDLISCMGLIRSGEEQSRVKSAIERHRIRSTGPQQSVGALSGGNQQKAMLARWLTRKPEVILLDEPTRGVDVGAKVEIHALIDRLAGMGKAILLISSDLPEVLGMSDRLLVMRAGRIVEELTGEFMTQENVILAASGVGIHAPERSGA